MTITRPIARSITRSITRGITEGIGGAAGLAYQALLDLSPILLVPSINDAYAEGRLWQDAAMTIPATAVDDPVGAVEDFSGNVYNFTASGDARPLLKQGGDGNYYLLTDGANDVLAASGVDLSGTNKLTVCLGFQSSSTALQLILELTANAAHNSGGFFIDINESAAGELAALFNGAGAFTIPRTASATISTGTPYVASYRQDGSLSTNEGTIRINGAEATDSYFFNSNTAANFANANLHWGSRVDTYRLSGRLYGLAIYPSILTDGQLQTVESYLAANSGVTL